MSQLQDPNRGIKFLMFLDSAPDPLIKKKEFYESLGCQTSQVQLLTTSHFKLTVKVSESAIDKQAF